MNLNRTTDIQRMQFKYLLDDIGVDVGTDYLLLALKKINDQQMLFINFSKFKLLDDPVIKVLDTIVREIEMFLFESEHAVKSQESISILINDYLSKSELLALKEL